MVEVELDTFFPDILYSTKLQIKLIFNLILSSEIDIGIIYKLTYSLFLSLSVRHARF